MLRRLRRWIDPWLPRPWRRGVFIPDSLWRRTVSGLPFLQTLNLREQNRLYRLCAHFLQEKEFTGAHELTVSDEMALSIAAQACFPLLHMCLPDGQAPKYAAQMLEWYDDFVGIVVQPGAALAKREVRDSLGVVHQYDEALAGEAMHRGPVMVTWSEVARAAELAHRGRNVVIHEFAHKLDMRGMSYGTSADGAPPLHARALGHDTLEAAQAEWRDTMKAQFDAFTDAVARAERFGEPAPWLDAYGSTSPAEFFAVTVEAFFTAREQFGFDFPVLLDLYDRFFRPLKFFGPHSQVPLQAPAEPSAR